jgi:hypothetical protein
MPYREAKHNASGASGKSGVAFCPPRLELAP